MTKTLKLKVRTIIVLALAAATLGSCSTSKKLKYFQDLPDDVGKTNSAGRADFVEPVIQAEDILAINVNTAEAEAGQVINARNGVNLSVGINNQTGSSGTGSGYLVDKQGDVELPILGKIHLAGLTTTQAKDAVRNIAKNSFKDPIVDVRFSNFKITVIGEVSHPAAYIFPTVQVSILDAIGYAGDLTIYGKRQNVLIMRRTPDGTITTTKLDLTKKDVINSPYFFLKQNDVVYVEPRRGRQDMNTENAILKYIGVAATVLTAIILLHHYRL